MNRKYVVGALFLVILLGALIAFGSVSLGPVNAPDQAAATQPIVSQMPTQVPRVKGSIGDRVEADGVALTVTGIEWKGSTAGTNQGQGNQPLLVHIIAENTNPTFDLEVAAGDFEIRRSNGQVIDFSPDSIVDDQLVDTTLAPGEKETKTVVFQLPASEETLHLLYDYNDQHMDIDLGQ
jgi:hypothetical protein